jgi:hypothetical protein
MPPPNEIKNEISIVHKIIELYKLFNEYLKSFPRSKKYTLGEKIENLIIELLVITLKSAYLSKDKKLPLLNKIDNRIFILKTLIRLAKETKSLDTKKYIILEEKLQEIGKMLGGWMKSIK